MEMKHFGIWGLILSFILYSSIPLSSVFYRMGKKKLYELADDVLIYARYSSLIKVAQ